TGRLRPADEQRSLVLYPDVLLVSFGPAGSHDHSPRDALALVSGGLSPLLAVDVTLAGRAASNRGKAADADPVDEHREPASGRSSSSPAQKYRVIRKSYALVYRDDEVQTGQP